MKKLLGLLGAMGLVATTSATVVSCQQSEGIHHGIEGGKVKGAVGDKKTITIQNIDLIDVAQSDESKELVKIEFNSSDPKKFSYELVKEGKTEITLKAKNKSAIIAFEITKAKLNFEFDKTEEELGKLEVVEKENIKVTIKNKEEITNLKAESGDTNSLTTSISGKEITISGVKEKAEKVKVTISADGFNFKEILVKVKAKTAQ